MGGRHPNTYYVWHMPTMTHREMFFFRVSHCTGQDENIYLVFCHLENSYYKNRKNETMGFLRISLYIPNTKLYLKKYEPSAT